MDRKDINYEAWKENFPQMKKAFFISFKELEIIIESLGALMDGCESELYPYERRENKPIQNKIKKINKLRDDFKFQLENYEIWQQKASY